MAKLLGASSFASSPTCACCHIDCIVSILIWRSIDAYCAPCACLRHCLVTCFTIFVHISSTWVSSFAIYRITYVHCSCLRALHRDWHCQCCALATFRAPLEVVIPVFVTSSSTYASSFVHVCTVRLRACGHQSLDAICCDSLAYLSLHYLHRCHYGLLLCESVDCRTGAEEVCCYLGDVP